MSKRHIKEVIVVEGYHDSEKLRKYFDCQTIETSGTHLGRKIIDQIRHAQENVGVIIFTDPDSPGNRIRHAINQAVPGCKNAFVDRKKAHTTKKIGVEHANYETLLEALENVVTFSDSPEHSITMVDMIDLGLNGSADSAEKREYIGTYFHLGNGNAKTMLRRLQFAGITTKQLKEVMDQWKD